MRRLRGAQRPPAISDGIHGKCGTLQVGGMWMTNGDPGQINVSFFSFLLCMCLYRYKSEAQFTDKIH